MSVQGILTKKKKNSNYLDPLSSGLSYLGLLRQKDKIGGLRETLKRELQVTPLFNQELVSV